MSGDGDFAGKVALVTGAASGIGRATAAIFARRGARVIALDLGDKHNEAHRLLDEIVYVGGEGHFVPCDVSVEEQVEAAISKTIEIYGALHHAFNCAGLEGKGRLTHERSAEQWDALMDVNLRGVWLCMKAQLRHMCEQGHGTIVNCSSGSGLRGTPNFSAYSTSKFGVLGLTRAAAVEYAPKGIRINAVCPGVIETDMVRRWVGNDQSIRDALMAATPMGRVGSPEDIANAVLWLSSSQASFVTGVSLPVDGGWAA